MAPDSFWVAKIESLKRFIDLLTEMYHADPNRIYLCGLSMGGGKLSQAADICIRVPKTETFKIQEPHLPVYHYLCAAVEAHFFKE